MTILISFSFSISGKKSKGIGERNEGNVGNAGNQGENAGNQGGNVRNQGRNAGNHGGNAVKAICKSRNGELGNRMRGLMGMRGTRVEMFGISLGMRGMGVGIQRMGVGMREILLQHLIY